MVSSGLRSYFCEAGLQPVDFGGVVHELPMLHAFNNQEVSDGFEDFPKVGHLSLDVEGRGQGELTVAQSIEFLEDFDLSGKADDF